ncbi:NAD(P)-dependent oxidoreductase [Persicobacter diffluens]|uniref:Saccharopine dehydrogenase [NAD(+), L-lysine-forming] n=1 Tax=Persicobacter diffluens TaxID=981 RepID=A0AAN4W0Q5_9BACT|nr:alanine dehydrogenase [Persicobacter diffluens]
MKIGLIKEGKTPPDRRVALTPQQCVQLQNQFKGLSIVVQPSKIRSISDQEYQKAGINLQENLKDCDIILGVKEVPIKDLLQNKQHLFFSHTHKFQPYNKGLLQACIQEKIQLIDYECLTWENGRRILGFGRFAGLIGAYMSLKAWGHKTNSFELPLPQECDNLADMLTQLKSRVSFSGPQKIFISGRGRVASGIREILTTLDIMEVNAEQFIKQKFEKVVFCNLDTDQYYTHKSRSFQWDHFLKNSKEYQCQFTQFVAVSDMLITGHFYDANWPVLIPKEAIDSMSKLKVIGDISCDINGPIPTTIRPSKLDDPFYDVNLSSLKEIPAFSQNGLTVMAVDNLPGALPTDASEDFGASIAEHIIPLLLQKEENPIITRATICKDGQLGKHFQYLQDWLKEK